MSKNTEQDNIVFFDGVCGLCSTTVDFLLKIDRNKKLRFAPLQGSTAKEYLSDKEIKELSSLIYLKGGIKYYKSDGVLKILETIGGIWGTLSGFSTLPRSIRDGAYELIAEKRYSLFGKKDECRIPTEAEKESFLP